MARIRHGSPGNFRSWFGHDGRSGSVHNLSEYRAQIASLYAAGADTNRANGVRAFTTYFLLSQNLFDPETHVPTIDTYLPESAVATVTARLGTLRAERAASEAAAADRAARRAAGGGRGGRGGGRARGTTAPVSPDGGHLDPMDPFAVHLWADHGVAGAGGQLPHGETIQRAFG